MMAQQKVSIGNMWLGAVDADSLGVGRDHNIISKFSTGPDAFRVFRYGDAQAPYFYISREGNAGWMGDSGTFSVNRLSSEHVSRRGARSAVCC